MRIIPFILLLILSVTAIGCNSTKENNSIIIDKGKSVHEVNPASSPHNKNVALVMKTLTNPFFVEMEQGARKAAKELGVNLTVKTGAQETSITQQIALIEDLIRDKVDGIVIAPASSIELIPILKKAQDANIHIINIDNQLDVEVSRKMGLQDVPFISVNNEEGAYLSAKAISEKITTPTEVVILEGIISAKNSQDRKYGALRAFSENNNIKVVAIETAHWKIDEAYEVTNRLYKQYPNIGAFFCANDMMALGTIKYLGETNKTKVLVAGYDALKEAKEAVRLGKLAVTIDQQADLQGYLGIKYALEKINGQQVSRETLVNVKIIQGENLK